MIFHLTKEDFSKRVENYVKEWGVEYLEAVIHFQEEYSYDDTLVASLVNQPLREKIEQEARDKNYRSVPKIKNKLPFA
jgi:hypothetical protein